MRRSIFSCFLGAGVLLAGCATARPTQSPAPTTVTASEPIARPAPAPVTAPAGDAPAPADATPPGELVCKTTDAMGVVAQLFVDGSKAQLRRVAPSGTQEVKLLAVGRQSGQIIADNPSETDLVVHEATVRDSNGKRYMRLGDWNQPWSACE